MNNWPKITISIKRLFFEKKYIDLRIELLYNHNWVRKMIYSTRELYLMFKEYRTPHIKIKTEVKNNRLFPVIRGLYEDNINTPGYRLVSYIEPNAYLSFEYVLSFSGLIPERVYTYTCATSLKGHTKKIETAFGNYLFQDIPLEAYMYGVKNITEEGYTYLMATPEKALCDLLYKVKPVYSVKELKELLFDNLRIDYDLFIRLNMTDIIYLCSLYKKKNLHFLKKYLEGLR